jgi:zinc D-Ala-D-Ala carboxypeptidase
MTKRQVARSDQRFRDRRPVVAAMVAGLALVLAVAGTPSPAAAAVPRVGQTWASLMYRSLTPSPAYLQLRKTLAGQRATLATRATQVTQGRATHETAQDALVSAISADSTARLQAATARETLISAKNLLTLVAQRRPVNATAVAEKKAVVTTATATLTARRTQAAEAAATLKTAQGAARTATVGLDAAAAGWQAASAAVRTNQQKLIAMDKATALLAGQAAALSRQVVTDARPTFTLADTTTVNGITVHKTVAFAFRQMLAAAKADGVVLSGGGFRTRQRQIELRKSNGCPDVWTAPASSCRVPTAIPGRSLHELGLAIDITSGGSSLTASSAGFRWMVANAATYGFVNLPSEPWHWSITGG